MHAMQTDAMMLYFFPSNIYYKHTWDVFRANGTFASTYQALDAHMMLREFYYYVNCTFLFPTMSGFSCSCE